MTIDSLLAAEVVTADGRHLCADAEHHSDLFWAIRGGGGNFGVVTSFEFRVYPAGTVLAGIVLHPASAAADAIRTWRDLEMEAPEQSTIGALLLHMPDDPSLPPALRAARSAMIWQMVTEISASAFSGK